MSDAHTKERIMSHGYDEYTELVMDMLGLPDDTSIDDVMTKFEEEFGLSMEACYPLVVKLLDNTPVVRTGLLGRTCNAFVSKTMPVIMMSKEVVLPEEEGTSDAKD